MRVESDMNLLHLLFAVRLINLKGEDSLVAIEAVAEADIEKYTAENEGLEVPGDLPEGAKIDPVEESDQADGEEEME